MEMQSLGKAFRSEQTPKINGGSTRQQSARPKRNAPRPVVISLDVTDSSEEDSLSDYAPSPSPEAPKEDEQPLFTPSPPREKQVSRGIMSDSDSEPESDCEEVVPVEVTSGTKKRKIDHSPDNSYDDPSDDLFAIDFNSCRSNAKKDAMKEMNEIMTVEKERDKEKLKKDVESSELADLSDLVDERSRAEDEVIVIGEPGSPEMLDELSPSLPKFKGRKRNMLKRNRETQKAIKKLEALANMAKKENDDSMNQSGMSDILVVSDDESDNINTEINLRVRWGTEYLRIPIKTTQKFSHIYQTLAERFNVGVGQILLSLNDKIINPEVYPKELGLKVADIIEGGIQSKDYSKEAESSENNDPGSIRLKVQNADKKGLVHIYINRYDKMQLLMEKYAKEKKVDVSTLRFHFDGEKLDPSDTPDNLDLDGDECIDVYHS
ncbi:DNA repair protein Rad60-like [Penaeus indicus]|uniref:DNA repair protein Rad60-like n=1 Tax=Penaeus indicus TaxID=29960 RepID=UPI00300CC4F3